MKQRAQSDPSGVQAGTEPARSRAALQQIAANNGRMAQLAAIMNGGPRVQPLTQLNDAAAQSSRVHCLMELADEINQGVPADSSMEGEAGPWGARDMAAQRKVSGGGVRTGSSMGLDGTAQLKIEIFGTLAHGDRSSDERGDAHASQPKNECGCGAKQDKSSGKQRKDSPGGKRLVQKKPVQQKRSDASPAATQLKQIAVEPVTPKPVQRRGVLQAVWAYLDAEGGEPLNLKSTSDPNVFELSRDGSKYVKAGTASDGRMIVKRQGGVHADWHYDSFAEYQNWTKGSQGVSVDAPFGSGKINAAHKRGAPKISSRQEDFGGAKLGDAYSDYVSGLQSGGKKDAEIATALLKLDDTNLVSELEKRAASMLHVTVYLAEEWRKQGAAKLYRAFLRSIENGEKTFKDFLTEYEFILSADEGRKQVARFTDVHRGVKSKSDLGPSEQIVYGNMSPLRDEDVESDSDMGVEKALSKTRDYSQKNKQPNIGWKDPWAK